MLRAQLEAEIAGSDGSEYALARRDFREFLRYVKVFEKPPGRGAIPFEFWPHLDEMIEALPVERRIVWMKARRNGASWLIAAYIVFKAQTRGSYFPLASQGEPEAIELLAKVRFVWANLPVELMWGPLTTDSRTELKWGTDGSHIQAMPSTGSATRGAAITVAVIDEAEFHEYLDTFYYAVKPSVDDSDGQLFLVSTIDYRKQLTLFRQLYRGTPANGFRRYFHGWRVRPGRDQTWYDERSREYPDQAKFQKEFPESADQALAPPSTLMAFDVNVLEAMRADYKVPIETVGGHTHIWQRWYTGKRYVAFSDTSHGTGADDAVTVILDVATGYVVADVHSNVLDPDALALASVKLLEQYHNPLWAIEDNDRGIVTIHKAQALNYPRLFYRGEGKVGWHTNERTRLDLWEDAIQAVSQRLLTVPSEAGLAQFYSVIRNPKKEGRIETMEGGKDDYPLAVGGAWQLRYRAVASHGAPVAAQEFTFRSRGTGLRW